MTVGELIESLKTLPQDMEIMVINEDRQDPVDIVTVSRGRYRETDLGSLIRETDFDDEDHSDDFIQDDEKGTIAVLVTW